MAAINVDKFWKITQNKFKNDKMVLIITYVYKGQYSHVMRAWSMVVLSADWPVSGQRINRIRSLFERILYMNLMLNTKYVSNR